MSHIQKATVFCIVAALFILSGRVNADANQGSHYNLKGSA